MSPSLLLVLFLAAPAFLTPSPSKELEIRGQRTPRDASQESMKVMISGGCITQGDSADVGSSGKEIDLTPGSPLVLTHKIKLVPSGLGSGSGSGSCGCEADFAALRERLERLEREVSNLREKCGAEGGCCSSKESKGPGCSIKPGAGECPNECSDQGRCVDGKCVCFSGFSGPDCSESECPGNCNNRGRCVNGQCVCDPGSTGPDCSDRGCPDNCNNRGRCVNGQCVCESGFAGPSCSDGSCPGNCNNRGRCVNGQCVCDAGFAGPDCSKRGCPGNCNNNGRCVNGRCVCDSGFSGADCSETGCPGNCNNRGRCVDGECVCNEGFGGPDCSEIICPNDCYDRGRCVNGVCQCDVGFSGEDCSETACPGNCNNRGRCVNGQCVCNAGFTGEDCSETACPGNCNNRGRCVNGQCVCDAGFTGEDCSETACPGNCNNRGRCVNGQCVCDAGFTGEDCSEDACPGNCNNRGRCVNGQCVCDHGFAGEDCSEDACPGNCNNRGRCVNGQCVCDHGFAGEDCSEKACPNNCSNRGKCVNGKCVCDVGFAGPDCAAKGCPNNCSNKGRCVKGRCVCRRGFTGPDCSQCEEGMTGPNCDKVMSGVSQLRTRDITETSVTLIWDPPPVRYETYYVTFTSKKEIDQKISEQVDGSLTTFTQTGLAAGQEYTVSLTGEVDGRKGAESTAEFMTLISGPSNLKVVKTSTTSAVVQWEESQGEIDRYRLTVTPSDGSGRSKDMTVPAGQDSAQIQELEAGRLYDIILVAEKGGTQSGPATTQVTPGQTPPRGSTAALTLQVPTEPRQDADGRDPPVQPDRGVAGSGKDRKASVDAKKKPPLKKKVAPDGTKPKPPQKPTWPKKPNVPGQSRLNTTRVVPGGKKVGQGPPKKIPVGERRKVQVLVKKPQPGVPTAGDRAPSTDGKDPAMVSGIDSDTRRESSSEGPALTVGSKEQPDVGREGRSNDTAPVSSEPTGTIQSQDKKCFNKVKVTHLRLPVKDRGSGCRAGGDVLAGKTPDDTPDVDYSSDPLYKLLTETYDSLNNTKFSVHLSKASDLVHDAESVREQILDGLKPLSSFRSSSDPQQSSESLSPPLSEALSSLTAEPSSSPLSSPAPSPSSPSSPSSSSSSESSDTSESDEAETENSRRTVSITSPEEQRPPTPGKTGPPFFRRTSTKPGYVRRPNVGPFQNRTNQNLRFPQRPPSRLNPDTRGETEITQTSTGEIRPSATPSASEEPASGDLNAPVRPSSGDKDEEATPSPSGVEEKKTPTEKGKVPFRRPPPKGGNPRQQFANSGPFQNRTRPNRRPLPAPSRPVNFVSETSGEQISSSETPAPSSSPVPKELYPAEGSAPVQEENSDRSGPTHEFNQTLTGGVGPSAHRPAKAGPYRRPMYGGRFQNRTNTNLRPLRGPIRRPLPNRNGGIRLTPGSPTNQLEKQGTDEIPGSESGEQDAPKSPHGVQVRPSEEQDSAEEVPSTQIHRQDSTEPETNVPQGEGGAPVQTTEQVVKETSIQDSNQDEENLNGGQITGDTSPGRPTAGEPDSPNLGRRPVSHPKREPPARGGPPQTHPSRIRHYFSEGQRRENKTDGSKVPPTGVTRRPLDHVGVTNRTSGGFALVWDSPEGRYKNFVVTRTKVEKDDRRTDQGEKLEDSEREDVTGQPTAGREPGAENRVPETVLTQLPRTQTSTTAKPAAESDQTFKKTLPASARSFQFDKLPPQTEYTVTLLGKGSGILSRMHKLVISTGPEPPKDIVFSELTERSLTVSWTKPKTAVSGFKVTYTHTEEGEPVSVSVDSGDSSLGLSQLSPGSTYEVSIISVLGLDESDPLKDFVVTLPDPPTDLRAVNVTDTTALLLWRPALAAVDKYAIVYGSGTDSELRVTVSGNAAEHPLTGLQGSTTYTVTITSQLGSQESSKETTSFTTTGGSGGAGEGPRDLQATNVTPRTALISWKPPRGPVGSYRLTYQTEDQQMKEVIIDASVTQFNLSRLYPGSKYNVQLQAENGGRFSAAIATEFTTGTLRFPFPTDCTQELQNGIRTSGEVEIFPQGKHGTPLMVYCDMETDGGGWMVFQRRKDGSVDFFRGWKDYTKGFGDLSGEFWLGLDNLHNLTTMTKMNLRVDLRDGDDAVFAKYSTFEVAKRHYKLSVGGYSGTAGDSLTYHNNRLFSTKDRDPMPFITRCAMSYRGGWWYKNCHEANLNGLYGIDVKHQGIIWTGWKGKEHSIPFTEMKMRPASFRG